MENQVLFDTVVNHLRNQGCKAEDENGKCLYRGPNNTKCAFGILIPDNEYTPEFENHGLYGDDTPEKLALVDICSNHGYSIDLVKALQVTHDCTDIRSWETEFKRVATRFNLQYNETEKIVSNNPK